MRWLLVAASLILSAPALAQFDDKPPPDWMVRGFEAAVADRSSVKGAVTNNTLISFVKCVPPGDRAGAVIDKLLPLLGDRQWTVRSAAAQALGQIPPGDRAGAVIDKLLPLLGDPDSDVRSAAAQALGQIPPGDRAGAVIDKLLPLLGDPNSEVRSAALRSISRLGPASSTSAIAAIRDIDAAGSEATGWLRAAAHIATGADTKQEGSELLLAWLGHPAALPSDSVADKPGAAHEVLELLTNNWAAIAKEPRAREEAENAAMAAAVNAACRTPAETDNFADLARAASAWVRDLPFEGPVHRCWSSEQKSTVEELLTDFKESHSTHENELAAHLKGEEIAPVSLWLTRGVVAWTLAWAVFLVAFPWSRIVQSIFFWNPRARKLLSLWFVPLLLLIVPPLRRRLLAPFRDDLVAAARLEDLPKARLFP